jgi:hypothetical protein
MSGHVEILYTEEDAQAARDFLEALRGAQLQSLSHWGMH